jgi:L-threonylcarbamoyladenylate synthase
MIQTKIYQAPSLTEEEIKHIAALVKSGGLCVLPTETVYGLAGNGLDPSAIKKIYEAKGRPSDNPLILHIADKAMLKNLVREIPKGVVKLMDEFWPGPLTLVFKKSDYVPKEATGGLDSVAIRMPSHPVMQKIIQEANVPLAAPSANLSGKPSSTRFSHVYKDLNGKIEAMIDGGESTLGIESTVLDISSFPWTILRPGFVTQAMIEKVVGHPILKSNPISPLETPKSPGMKYRHYQPQGMLHVIVGQISSVVPYIHQIPSPSKGVICTQEWAHHFNTLYHRTMGSIHDLTSMGSELYAALREMDDREVEDIYLVAHESMGEALLDRIKKASSEWIELP